MTYRLKEPSQWAVSSNNIKDIFRLVFILFLIGDTPLQLASQKISYYADIQPIVYKHCVACHQPGSVAPFSLLEYDDAVQRAEMMLFMTQKGLMPPWYADTTFQSYHNQRVLPVSDIKKLANWIEQGKKKGKKVKKTPFPEVTEILDPPDLVFEMDTSFVVPGNNQEQFRLFVIPTNTQQDYFVRGIEYVPGNRTITHHCRMMLDTSHLVRRDHTKSINEVPEFDQINVPLADQFWQGWVPGNMPVFYQEGQAKLLPRNADIVLNVHYSPSPVPEKDRPKVRIWLAKETPKHLIRTYTLGENSITNQPFVVYANDRPTFYLRSPVLQKDMTLISVLPHMHLLGQSFRAFVITPGGNMIPLVKIDRWNFKWQTSYQFKEALRIPKGSVIYAEASYDNTINNPQNPFNPPKDAQYGWGTFNEMMNLILEFIQAD
jgi:hypothetical protein